MDRNACFQYTNQVQLNIVQKCYEDVKMLKIMRKNKPRPIQWTLTKVYKWLDDCPLTNSDDITFINNELAEQNMLANAQKREGWNGMGKCYLERECLSSSLIPALVENDEIKWSFWSNTISHKNDWRSKTEKGCFREKK